MEITDGKNTVKIDPQNWPLALDIITRHSTQTILKDPIRVNSVTDTLGDLIAWNAFRKEGTA